MGKINLFAAVGLGLVLLINCMKKQEHKVIAPEIPTYSFQGLVKDVFHQVPLENVNIVLYQDSALVDTVFSGEFVVKNKILFDKNKFMFPAGIVGSAFYLLAESKRVFYLDTEHNILGKFAFDFKIDNIVCLTYD